MNAMLDLVSWYMSYTTNDHHSSYFKCRVDRWQKFGDVMRRGMSWEGVVRVSLRASRCGERIADGWEVLLEGCRWYPGLFNFWNAVTYIDHVLLRDSDGPRDISYILKTLSMATGEITTSEIGGERPNMHQLRVSQILLSRTTYRIIQNSVRFWAPSHLSSILLVANADHWHAERRSLHRNSLMQVVLLCSNRFSPQRRPSNVDHDCMMFGKISCLAFHALWFFTQHENLLKTWTLQRKHKLRVKVKAIPNSKGNWV